MAYLLQIPLRESKETATGGQVTAFSNDTCEFSGVSSLVSSSSGAGDGALVLGGQRSFLGVSALVSTRPGRVEPAASPCWVSPGQQQPPRMTTATVFLGSALYFLVAVKKSARGRQHLTTAGPLARFV